MARVHVIGAGLAGLSAAVRLADKGADVVVHEQAAQAGGRARSFHDAVLDCTIDNGNHLLLSGNRSALGMLDIIGARQRLTGPKRARFDFYDLESKERWSVDLNRGPVPMWTLYKNRRVPGTSLGDYLSGLKLLTAGNRTVAGLFADQGQMYRRFWEPFSIAVLNTLPEEAVARLLVPVIRETLAKGADASRPLIAKQGLSETFADPALKWLGRRADIRLGQRVSRIETDASKATSLTSGKHRESIGEEDRIVLAVPPWAVEELLPEIQVPNAFAPIVNVHFRLESTGLPLLESPILGLIGSPAHWLFIRGEIASVTVSAAMEMVNQPQEEIAAKIWPDIACALDRKGAPMPAVRIIKERRATFCVTAKQLRLRPKTTTGLYNLVLAGDWIDTGLPATIEGAVRSGEMAVAAIR